MPLDIGFGILSTIFLARATSLPLNFLTVLSGIVFALLPDLDFLAHLARRKADAFSHEHRNLLHNPLLFIPIGFIILIFINIGLAYLFALCSFIHFLHDSIGMGWGIRWAYPFSKKYYKFFSDKRGGMANVFLTSWTPEEQKRAALQFGNPHWLVHYLKFSREFLMELLVLAISIGFLVYTWPH